MNSYERFSEKSYLYKNNIINFLMKALLIGATGATGSDLLELLLNDSEVESIDIFVRRDPGIEHSKLKVHVVDFERYEVWRHLVKGMYGNVSFSNNR